MAFHEPGELDIERIGLAALKWDAAQQRATELRANRGAILCERSRESGEYDAPGYWSLLESPCWKLWKEVREGEGARSTVTPFRRGARRVNAGKRSRTNYGRRSSIAARCFVFYGD